MENTTLDPACLMDGCQAPPAGRGLCPKHYAYVRRHGQVDQYPPVGRYAPKRVCGIDGCDVAHSSRDMCMNHYLQWYRKNRGTDVIRPVRTAGAPAIRDASGRKLCATCERWLEVEKFSAYPPSSDGYHSMCNDCKRARRYGLTHSDLAAMLGNQDGRCKVCSTELFDSWHVDHDHACCPGKQCCGYCVRGILCIGCNIGLGKFGDNLDGVKRVVRYLENWEKEKAI